MERKTSSHRLALLTGLAVIIGLLGGLAAWVLLHLIALVTNFAVFGHASWHTPSYAHLQPSFRIIIVAVAGAFIISTIAHWVPGIRGHGIPETMEAILTNQSRITPKMAIAKPLSAAVAIGTAAPFGAEGPIIVTGGAIGSLIGQVVPVSPAERKILLAAGAAAGMAAVFGAPLAAVVLAIELLLFEFSARALVPLVVAASVAAGVHGELISTGPLFHIENNHYAGLSALPAFAVLGVACGVLAIVLSKGLFFVEALYRRLPVKQFFHPVIGAVLFASIGLIEPRALGVGYDAISDVLNDKLALGTVALLCIVKALSWMFALGSGTSGGTLAPILLISASFGSMLGHVLQSWVPGSSVTVGAFSIVAMAAVFGASTRATFAAIVFVFELTGDYQVILPLMLATVIADLIYNWVMDDSIMTERLHHRGFLIGRHFGVDPMETTYVRDIMTMSVDSMPSSMTIGDARATFLNGGHGAYPIKDEDEHIVGIVTREDLLQAEYTDTQSLDEFRNYFVSVKPGDVAVRVEHVMVDESTEHVLVMDKNQLVGICTHSDLLKVRAQHREAETRQSSHFAKKRLFGK